MNTRAAPVTISPSFDKLRTIGIQAQGERCGVLHYDNQPFDRSISLP